MLVAHVFVDGLLYLQKIWMAIEGKVESLGA